MATRKKVRTRTASAIERQHRVQELESILAAKDLRIRELENQLAIRDTTITDLERVLEGQIQSVKKLRRERDELRDKNASLVGKLAEVSRKQSLTSTTPPNLPRFHRSSTCRLPSLPSHPESPDHTHLTNGSTPHSTPSSHSLHSGPHTESSITEDSDTDYSDLEDNPPKKTTPPKKEDPHKTTDPPKETKKDPTGVKMDLNDADAAIQGVLSTAEKVGIASWGTPPRSGGEGKVKSMAAEYGRKQRHASSSPPSRRSSSSPPIPSGRGVVIPRQRQDSNSSTSSSSSSREGSYNVNVSKSIQRIGSSEVLASQIRQILPPSKRSPDNPTKKNSLAEKYTDKSPVQNGNVAFSISESVSNGGVELLSGPAPLQNENVTLVSGPISIPSTSGTVEKQVPDPLEFSSSAPGEITNSRNRGSVSSEYQSSEGDLESSVDVRSPTVQYPHPAVADTPTDTPTGAGILKSEMKSLPNLISEKDHKMEAWKSETKGSDESKDVIDGSKSGKRRVTIRSFQDDSDLNPGEEEDQLNELEDFSMSNIRSRTQTLSALTGGKRRMEIGRKKLREHRSDMKRFSSMTTPLATIQDEELLAKDKLNWKKELELLSPLLQAKIRNMTLKRIYAEYGGKDVVTKAVGVIEEAYRTYKLHKRFQERLKEKRENRTMQRKRAQSLRQPHRRPSIMSKERRYGTKSKEKDPITKSKEAAERLAKERLPHAHSGARLELMEKRRSDMSVDSVGSSVCQEGLPEEEEEEEERDDEVFEPKTKKKLVPTISVSQIQIEVDQIEVKFSDPGEVQEGLSLDKTDGIVASNSSNSLEVGTRPLSIFSTTSIESSSSGYVDGYTTIGDRSRTLPHPSHMSHKDANREVELKLKVGLHHFNKKPVKGIQYLIRSSLLEDDPKKVADFFIHQKGLSKEKVGQFLGEISSEFNMAVLESLVERSNMGNKPIDEALREFQQLFRMPGEAQKIDKIMEVFALEYYKHNKSLGVFKSEDGAYILSFAIMMLHTSLHNPSVKSRTSRKQWVSMNRGTNDGENFPDQFLLEIFDRIQAKEFATGKDHTHHVAEIEKQIVGSTIPKLSVPHRYLVLRMSASEVAELNVRPSFRNRHRRTFFFFNDIVVICKRKHNEFLFRESFSLLSVLPVKFETHHYKCGVQLHAVDREFPFQFNCDTPADREMLIKTLEGIAAQLKLLDNERIAELGTSLGTKPAELGTEGRGQQSVCGAAGDLISSLSLSSPTPSPQNKRRDDFVPGVGDLLVTSSLPSTFLRPHPSDTENRISRDSGFSSQQLTPTPPPSPSNPNPNPDINVSTPTPSPLHTPNISPSASLNTLTPSGPPRSKSNDALKQLQVQASPTRSPSMDLLRRRRKSSPAPSPSGSPLLEVAAGKGGKKKERVGSDKGFKKGFFSSRKVKDSTEKGKVKNMANGKSREKSASPQPHRKLHQSLTLSYEENSADSEFTSSVS